MDLGPKAEMREIRTSGLMSGIWKRDRLGHRARSRLYHAYGSTRLFQAALFLAQWKLSGVQNPRYLASSTVQQIAPAQASRPTRPPTDATSRICCAHNSTINKDARVASPNFG